jgi:hypothetical protein
MSLLLSNLPYSNAFVNSSPLLSYVSVDIYTLQNTGPYVKDDIGGFS